MGARCKDCKKRNVDELVADWNKNVPVGTAVMVADDFGTETERKTESEAFVMSGDTPVCMFSGIRGAYMLDRARVVE